MYIHMCMCSMYVYAIAYIHIHTYATTHYIHISNCEPAQLSFANRDHVYCVLVYCALSTLYVIIHCVTHYVDLHCARTFRAQLARRGSDHAEPPTLGLLTTYRDISIPLPTA